MSLGDTSIIPDGVWTPDHQRYFLDVKQRWSDDFLGLIEAKNVTGLVLKGIGREGVRLPHLECIEEVRVQYCDPFDFAALYALPNIAALTTRNAKSSKPFDLSRLPRLRDIDLDWSPKLLGIGALGSLESATIRYWGSENLRDFATLSGIQQLKIHMARNLITTAGVEHLGRLVSLSIFSANKLFDLRPAARAPRLKQFCLEACRAAAGSLAQLYDAPCLEELFFGPRADIPTIKGIEHMTRLQRVSFSDCRIEDGDLAPLMRLEALEHVHVCGRKNYHPSVEEVGEHLRVRKAGGQPKHS